MSFLTTIFHGIGKAGEFLASKGVSAVVSGLQVAGPFVGMLNPAAGAIIAKIVSTAVGVEAMITAEQQGVLKKDTVRNIALAELPLLENVIAQFGPHVVIPEKELGDLIDASVAELNAADRLLKAIEAANMKKVATA